ncbi:MAG TPA: chemotaxis response regulator protein-glutamate methylesterase [Terriglobales bacterium]|jgi:two-component system chemotaxis response regulator CheB|nr:chemotaxis response regulator protein-glutamate methylesterase [Terriglobales bacterium]
MSDKIRVLVVDDSAVMRKLIPQILERDPTIEVVGTAMDGAFGLKKIEEVHPHVITLDLEMPRMDGTEMLRQIMRSDKIPVIIVSSHSVAGAAATFKALALGAFDFIAKPRDGAQDRMDEIASELIAKIKVAAKARMHRWESGVPANNANHNNDKPIAKPAPRLKASPSKIIAIGSSTGGPNTLQYLLSQLPADFSAAMVVVQHMPEGFTEMFAKRLDESCSLEVKEAQSGDLLLAGRVLIAPGSKHMRVRRMPLGDIVVLSDDPPHNGHRPSVDLLFRSVAQEFGPNAIAILMTGMGDDGADGVGAVRAAGGLTIAQSEESCVVFGMPKAAIDKGFVTRVVPLETMANTLQVYCSPGGPMQQGKESKMQAEKK